MQTIKSENNLVKVSYIFFPLPHEENDLELKHNPNWTYSKNNKDKCLAIRQLAQYLKLINTDFYIAGGAVRDSVYSTFQSNTPKDIDLYFVNKTEEEQKTIYQFLSDLDWNHSDWKFKKRKYKSYIQPIAPSNKTLLDPVVLIKAELIHKPTQTLFQLMFSEHKIEKVLSSFDWLQCTFCVHSTNLSTIWGLSYDTVKSINSDIDWNVENIFLGNMKLELINWHDPLKTLRRGFYMVQRHNLTLKKEDMTTLMTAFLLNQDKYEKLILKLT